MSCIGKVFHKIIAKRLERYLITNKIIDTSTQKGFISGINGTMEHTFALNSILENARANSLPVFVTFLDLKNCNGLTKVKYLDSSATEILNLKSTPWHFTRKSAKKFLPPEAAPPEFPLKKIRERAQQTKTAASSRHKVKGFADDLTVISRSLSSHQNLLETTVTKCIDLDLYLRLDKCVSILYNRKKLLDNSSVQLPLGRTSSIPTALTKFLGGYIGHSCSVTTKSASSRLLKTASNALGEIDKQPIRGEYKCWILKHYLAPSLHFYLAIDDIPEETIKRLQTRVNKIVKKWLNLPRSATLATVYHPSVLALPFFPHARLNFKAKVDYLHAISTSRNPLLSELSQSLSTQNLPMSIPPPSFDILQSARDSIGHLPFVKPASQLKKVTRHLIQAHQASYWDTHLETLAVQSKFKDVVALETDCQVWNRIHFGLPAGQLSFLLRAGADCLPTPLNLRRWRIQTNPKCPLCSWPHPTTMHILNGCATALNQGRYTWQHNSVLQTLVKVIIPALTQSETLYADLPGLRSVIICQLPFHQISRHHLTGLT